MRLSNPMVSMLLNAYYNRHLMHGLSGRSAMGGAQATYYALVRRRLLGEGVISEAGVAAAQAIIAKDSEGRANG